MRPGSFVKRQGAEGHRLGCSLKQKRVMIEDLVADLQNKKEIPPIGFLPAETAPVDLSKLRQAFCAAAGEATGLRVPSGQEGPSLDRVQLQVLLDRFFGQAGKLEAVAVRSALLKGSAAEHRVSWVQLRDAMHEGHYRQRVPLTTRIFALLDDPSCSRLARMISLFVMVLIVVSSVSFVLETSPRFRAGRWCQAGQGSAGNTKRDNVLPSGDCDLSAEPGANPVFESLETVCIIAFTIEYFARLLTAHAAPRDLEAEAAAASKKKFEAMGGNTNFMGQGTKTNAALAAVELDLAQDVDDDEHVVPSGTARTLSFMCGFANIIDLVAILPFYIALVVSDGPGGLSVLRVLRLARIFRIFKLGKYNEGMQMYGRVVGNSSKAFSLLIFFFVILMILFGSIIFASEQGQWYGPGEECPSDNGAGGSNSTCAEKYGGGAYLRPNLSGNGGLQPTPFVSILHGFWWVIVTCTTVGYGDYFPTTTAGKIVGFIAIPIGIVVIALPILIVANNFTAEYYSMQERAEARRAEKEIEEFAASSAGLTGTAAVKAQIALQTLVERAERNGSFKLRQIARTSRKAAVDTLTPEGHIRLLGGDGGGKDGGGGTAPSRAKKRRNSALGFAVYKPEAGLSAAELLDSYEDVAVHEAQARLVRLLKDSADTQSELGLGFIVEQIDGLARAAEAGQSANGREVDEVLYCALAFVSSSEALSGNVDLRLAMLAFCAACCADEVDTGEGGDGAAAALAAAPAVTEGRKPVGGQRRASVRRVSRLFNPDKAAALKADVQSELLAEDEKTTDD